MEYIPHGQIDDKKALIQIMAKRRICYKPLSELLMV